MTNITEQSAVERADALLTRWQKSLSPAVSQTKATTIPSNTEVPGSGEVQENTEGQANGLIERVEQNLNGRRLVEAVAYGYVALAAKTGTLVDPLVKTWQEGVAQAQRQQEQQAAHTQGTSGAHQEEANEKEGQQTLKKTAGAATDVAGTAAGA